MQLLLEKETYGILFFNTNSFDILDDFLEDYNKNYDFNDIEILGTWRLFGIHDVMILIKATKPESNLTNFMDYCRGFTKVRFTFDTPTCDDGEVNKLILGLCNNSLKKEVKIIEFWCDPLIPFKVDEKKLNESNFPFLIAFLRVENFNIDKIIKINDLLDKLKISDKIAGFFQGYGLYDLIIILKCEDYIDVQNNLNILRRMCLNESSVKNSILLLDTASIMTVSTETDSITTFSALLKISPASDNPKIWNAIKKIVETIVIKNGMKKNNCELIISHRQGFFDIIITVTGYFNDYIELLRILNCLPFVEDVATILRNKVED